MKRINTKTIGAKVKRKKNGQWAKGTPPPNPNGAPKRGQSWAEVIKEIAELTPDEARKLSAEIFSKIDIHDPITLKQAVVMRVYAAMLFDPQPGLIKEFIDRADGKVTQRVEMTWEQELEQHGISAGEVFNQLVGSLVAAGVGRDDDAGGSGGETASRAGRGGDAA